MRLNRNVKPVAGFADVVGPQLIRSENAVRRARKALALRGYVPIETPLIEHSELFLRRSGGVLSSQMYAFNSPDGADVSIRPEMTAPVIRHALEDGNARYPRRFQYAAPVIRYPEHSSTGAADVSYSNRSFTQVGAELIGHDSPESDGEVIAAACEAAAAVGIDDCWVVLGHAGLTRTLLERLKIPRGARQFLALNIERLKNEASVEAIVREVEGLLAGSPAGIESFRERYMDRLSAIQPAGATDGVAATGTLGRRSIASIDARIRDAFVDDGVDDLETPFRFVSKLASISGELESAANALTELCDEYVASSQQQLDPTTEIKRVRRTVDCANNEGIDPSRLTVDFGLPVGMAYYTGMVFELRADLGQRTDMKLGSGGRYDSLAYALGASNDIPALGFALNLDEILAAKPGDLDEQTVTAPTVLVGTSDSDQLAISAAARTLRQDSESVVVCYGDIADAKTLAASIGQDAVCVVRADGTIETVPV